VTRKTVKFHSLTSKGRIPGQDPTQTPDQNSTIGHRQRPTGIQTEMG